MVILLFEMVVKNRADHLRMIGGSESSDSYLRSMKPGCLVREAKLLDTNEQSGW